MTFFKSMFIIAVYLCYISVKCHGSFVEDYYWRDYKEVTPADALKAGRDRSGNPIYLGQVLYNNKLIPGEIYENASEIHIEFHDAHVLKKAIKILCTQHPEVFEWVQTRHDNVLDKRNKHIIFEGGYEEGHTTYVGRAVSHGELTVGKVICHATGCYKLTTIDNGKWYEHDIFEILTYNANAKITPTASTTTSTSSTTPSTAATFYADVYKRQPPSTVGHSSKAVEEETSSTTEYVSTVLNQQVLSTVDPISYTYNSGVDGSFSVFLYLLLAITHCYQLYQTK